MHQFKGTCPYCHRKQSFNTYYAGPYTPYDYAKSNAAPAVLDKWKKEYHNNELRNVYLGGVCPQCQKPVLALCIMGRDQHLQIAQSINDEGRICNAHIINVTIYPNPVEKYAHPSIPENIRSAFVDVQEMLDDCREPFIIMTTCRTILENSLDSLEVDKKSSLFERINILRKNGKITNDIAEWANIIRQFGNDSVHTMKGTQEEAAELVDFTRIFLMYVFELPARIKEKKRNKS